MSDLSSSKSSRGHSLLNNHQTKKLQLKQWILKVSGGSETPELSDDQVLMLLNTDHFPPLSGGKMGRGGGIALEVTSH